MHRSTTGNFRQLRVTATHELPTNRSPEGRFSVTVMAKPLNAEWTQKHVVFRTREWAPARPLECTEDVILAVVTLLSEAFLQADPPQ